MRKTTLSQRLKLLINESDSQADLANKLGIPKANVSRWFNKEVTEIKSSDAVAIVNSLGVTYEWLLEGKGSREKGDLIVNIPKINVSAALGPGFEVSEEQIIGTLGFTEGWLRYKNVNPKKAIVIKAYGDSMAPTVPHGSSVLVDLQRNKIVNDKIYAISVMGSARIKRVVANYDGSLNLISDNPEHRTEIINPDDVENLKIVGECVFYGKDL